MVTSTSDVSRRGVLVLAGSAALVSVGVSGLRRPAWSADTVDIADAARAYISARARSARPGANNVSRSGMSAAVYAFERDRAAFMRSLGQHVGWDGNVQSFSSTVDALSVTFDKPSGLGVASLYETMTVQWVPNERTPDPEFEKLRAESPERYDVGKPSGGVLTTSLMGTSHELRFDRSTGGWTVVEDTYFEWDLFGNSPTAKGRGPVVVERAPKRRRSQLTTDEEGGHRRAAARLDPPYDIYHWQAACTYAADYALNYNSNYVHYNCSGGDCANFVSQCFWAGGQIPAGNWDRHKTSGCGGTTNKWGGTWYPWYNNQNLRGWVLNQNRGGDRAGIGALGKGDIINYDWEVGGDGTDHVAILTNAASRFVCSHNVDRKNVPWELGGAAGGYVFTGMSEHY